MYAVIQTGGKQYRVEQGDTIRVEKLDGDVGSKVEFTDVLMVGGERSAQSRMSAKSCPYSTRPPWPSTTTRAWVGVSASLKATRTRSRRATTSRSAMVASQ